MSALLEMPTKPTKPTRRGNGAGLREIERRILKENKDKILKTN